MNKNEFIEYLDKLNIEISSDIYDKLELYYKLLVEWNNKFNMTSIINKEDVFLLHFYDSICLSKILEDKEQKKLCDFGTGAGFPGMIVAIFYKNIDVTLIESNQKKCLFLEKIKEKLNLNNVKIICDRIEEYGKNNREIFDYVTCRAVTSLPIIIEISTSTLKKDGLLIPLKSREEKIEEYNYLLKEFGLDFIKKIEYELPITNAYRCIYVIKKKIKTNIKYPQKYSSIIKKYKNK